MITVENFYWVLFEILLKPVGLDCCYYYPWGTKEALSYNEFTESVQNPDHVFFHFDQEPLWSENLGPYDSCKIAYSCKLAKIFANSERSELKKQICKSRGFLDWYFFYHGFAALDWYGDCQYVQENYPIKNLFLSFNHMFNQRQFRVALLARLCNKNIMHQGSISFHAQVQDILDELQNPNTRLSKVSKNMIQDNMSCFTNLPWKLDDVPINGNLSAELGFHQFRLWQSSLWHIVNETVFYEEKLHLTEKVFKPIVAKRPFILAAAPGNLKYLRSYGFQTFDRWIDESYDDIQDPDLRMDAIVDQIARFSHMGRSELQDTHRDMMSVLDYNKQHFFGKFREIIVNELVDNFDHCIRIWNNGRVDGRELAIHPDLGSAKKILMK